METKHVNWLIATYAATHTCMALEQQLQSLFMYMYKSIDMIRITQVTVIVPPVRECDQDRNCGANYYNEAKWFKLLERVGIKLVTLPYVGTNQYASYDQWIQGYLAYPNFQWYICIEDDYLIHPDAPSNMVDQLVYFHDSSAVTGKGVYACTLASTMGPMLENLPYHSAVSNGIIGREAFAAIPNILETFYKMVDESPLRDSQIAFSNMFMAHHVPVRSLHELFAAMFWSSSRLQLENYSSPSITTYWTIPLQMLVSCGNKIKIVKDSWW